VALANQSQLSAEFPGDTAVETLSADVTLGGGEARLDPLTAVLPGITVTGTGTLDLLQQDFRASFRAQLQEALGERDPACKLDDTLTDLRWPIACRGNLADTDPSNWCALETDQLLQDLAEQEAKRRLKKEAGKLLKKLFDEG
jgi:hypothetical protein